MRKRRLLVIDANALIHRAYHALPSLTTSKGELVNAVYGFLLVFFKTIKEFEPDFIAACFDLSAPTFRHKEFAEYKATRVKAPDELYEQIPKVKEALQAFSVPIFEKEGFEADDLIGTISNKAESNSDIETIILSGDLDTLQVVDQNTRVYTLKRGVKDTILYDEEMIKERYQISPAQLPDFKALTGDVSDNIPGARGIGEKTAIGLIKEFKSLENLYKEAEGNTERAKKLSPKIRETLKKSKSQVFFSRMLAKIRQDVPIEFNIKDCEWQNYDKAKAIKALKELEFFSLINRLPLKDARVKDEQKDTAQGPPQERLRKLF